MTCRNPLRFITFAQRLCSEATDVRPLPLRPIALVKNSMTCGKI
jgi:hypothetical protein